MSEQNEVALSQSFEERMRDRIKESIGELLSDEDLKIIIEKGVEDALFKRRVVYNSYGNTREIPSLVDTLTEESMKEQMEVCVRKWLEENGDMLVEHIEKRLQEEGMKFFLDAFMSMMERPMQNLTINLRREMESLMMR